MTETTSHWTVLNKENGMTYGGVCDSKQEAQKVNARFWREGSFSQIGGLLKEDDAWFLAPILLPVMLFDSLKEYFADLKNSQTIELKPGDHYRPWGGGADEYIHGVNDVGMPHMHLFGHNLSQQKS